MVIEPKAQLLARQAQAFKLLTLAGAWQLKKGSATIHFDKEGTPTTVEVRAFTYGEVVHTGESGQSVTVIV